MTLTQIILHCGTIAWFATAIVYKDGPVFTINNSEYPLFAVVRNFIDRLLGQKISPTKCAFCIGPWIAVISIPVGQWLPPFIYFFGILGIAAFVRGGSQEYG